MIEGRGSADFGTVRRMAYGRPDLLQRLVDVNAEAVAAYLNEQIAAGADAVMIFDTWGGMLSTPAYRAFSLASMSAVVAALRPAPDGHRVPTIVFTKGGSQWLDALVQCGASAIGLDWTADLAQARRIAGARVALQGNLDPLVLLTDPDTVRARGHRGGPGGGTGAGAHLQPRAWHRSDDAAGKCRARWSRLYMLNHARSALLLDPHGSSLGKMRRRPRQCWVCGVLTNALFARFGGQLCTRPATSAPQNRHRASPLGRLA